MLDDYQHDSCRKEAVRSLGRIGPKVGFSRSSVTAQAVPRLANEIESPWPPFLTVEAAEALAAMGPAAKAAVPSFGRAWNRGQGWLTIKEAQALYKIDPHAAETFQIPRDDAAAAKLQKFTRDDNPRNRRVATTTLSNSADRGLQTGGADDPEQLAGLVRRLNDDDPIIRRETATALYAAFRFPMRFKTLPPSVIGDLIAATKRPETNVCAAALAVLRYMGPAAAEAVPTLIEIIKNPPGPDRLQVMYALGQIGPAAAPAVRRLSEMLSMDIEPQERSAAAKALGAMGAAAKPAVPAFREGWEKHLLTIEDAQALYRIDHEAAEDLKIPRREASR